MVKIAIVEDNPEALNILKEYLDRYSKESKLEFCIGCYREGLSFLDEYDASTDLVFMDIDMPGMNGIEVSKRLRERDPNVVLIFVTNMAQFAIEGYSVDAMDFLLKPLGYSIFSAKMNKVTRRIFERRDDAIIINDDGNISKVFVRDIVYIDVYGHYLNYHLFDGLKVQRGNLSNLEKDMEKHGFIRANRSCMVNPTNISNVKGNELTMSNGEMITIGRSKKQHFYERLAVCLGENYE